MLHHVKQRRSRKPASRRAFVDRPINLKALHMGAGTPLFLPPEMFMRHWGPEADLWSLGMVTYQLLSGVGRHRI